MQTGGNAELFDGLPNRHRSGVHGDGSLQLRNSLRVELHIDPRLGAEAGHGFAERLVDVFERHQFCRDVPRRIGGPLKFMRNQGRPLPDFGIGVREGEEMLEIADLPSHSAMVNDQPCFIPGAEVVLPESAAQAVLSRGVMPILARTDRAGARFLRLSSVADHGSK